jgi:asparaginyl-tRNA synthetase
LTVASSAGLDLLYDLIFISQVKIFSSGRALRTTPRVGEIIGGSQREERHDVLLQRLRDAGLNDKAYGWHLDLRRYGTVPHAGFGLGPECMMMYLTGLKNIRDVIPFPRTPGNAEFWRNETVQEKGSHSGENQR